jgi:hypothetical protein
MNVIRGTCKALNSVINKNENILVRSFLWPVRFIVPVALEANKSKNITYTKSMTKHTFY